MKEYYTAINEKGQITIPDEVQALLKVKPKDTVAIHVDGAEVRLTAPKSALDVIFQSVPALEPPRSLEEIMEIAKEEHAREAARKGM